MVTTLKPTAAARLADPLLPSRIALASDAAMRLARRLRIRAYRRSLEDKRAVLHWQGRSSWHTVGFLCMMVLCCIALAALTPGQMSTSPWQGEVLLGMPFWAKLTMGGMVGFCGAMFLGAPMALLILYRHHLKDIFTARQIVSVRTDDRGIEATDRRGEQRHHAWRDLRRVWPFGRLDFGGDSPGTMAFAPRDMQAWQLNAQALTSVFVPQGATTRQKRRRVFHRCLVYIGIATLAALLMAATESDAETRRRMLGIPAAIAILGVLLALDARGDWPIRLLTRRRRARARTFGFAKFSRRSRC